MLNEARLIRGQKFAKFLSHQGPDLKGCAYRRKSHLSDSLHTVSAIRVMQIHGILCYVFVWYFEPIYDGLRFASKVSHSSLGHSESEDARALMGSALNDRDWKSGVSGDIKVCLLQNLIIAYVCCNAGLWCRNRVASEIVVTDRQSLMADPGLPCRGESKTQRMDVPNSNLEDGCQCLSISIIPHLCTKSFQSLTLVICNSIQSLTHHVRR